jgi:hypothetical protein
MMVHGPSNCRQIPDYELIPVSKAVAGGRG